MKNNYGLISFIVILFYEIVNWVIPQITAEYLSLEKLKNYHPPTELNEKINILFSNEFKYTWYLLAISIIFCILSLIYHKSQKKDSFIVGVAALLFIIYIIMHFLFFPGVNYY